MSWVGGAYIESCGEVADFVDMVLGEEGLGEFAQVELPEGSVLEGAVIEVEAVNIDVGSQSLPC